MKLLENDTNNYRCEITLVMQFTIFRNTAPSLHFWKVYEEDLDKALNDQ